MKKTNTLKRVMAKVYNDESAFKHELIWLIKSFKEFKEYEIYMKVRKR